MADARFPRPSSLHALIAVLTVLTALYVLAGAAAMLWLSPKVPYADPWRFLTTLATQPFPANVLHADNGHYEVVPNLIRLLELRWFGANQWLQVLAGAAFALSTFATLACTLREKGGSALRYAALVCAAALALFWLGNQRTLAHGNESLHAYLITLCLVAGLHLLQRNDLRATWGATALGVLATFSFGTGIACFAAFALVLWLQRADRRSWLVLVLGAGLAGALYLAGSSGGGSLQWAPVTQAGLLLRWLAAPWLYLMWPAVDPQIAAQVPTAVGQTLSIAVATGWEQWFGLAQTATWPWLGLGLAGLAWWLTLLVRVKKHAQRSFAAVVGVALAGFGLAVGGVIVAARADYFAVLHPDQLLAPRYLVWSSLFWGGLLIATIGIGTRHRRTACIVAVVAILALPSQLWMGRLAWLTRGTAEQAALGSAVGVLAQSQVLGETVAAEMQQALPHLRARNSAMYAWPETQLLGRTVPAGTATLSSRDWQAEVVRNRFDGPGARVGFTAEVDADRLLIVDAQQRAVGIAMPDRQANHDRWRGWIRGAAEGGRLRAVRLPPR